MLPPVFCGQTVKERWGTFCGKYQRVHDCRDVLTCKHVVGKTEKTHINKCQTVMCPEDCLYLEQSFI